MPALLLPAAFLAWLWKFSRTLPLRESFLKSLIVLATVCVASTEILSPFHAITRPALITVWLLTIASAFYPSRHAITPKPVRPTLVEALYLLAILTITGIVFFTALLSAPNSADAMAYHLPRVIYWMQSGSVAFFPTPYLNQIMLQPFHEYATLHTYILSGGDHFVNLVAFTGFAGSIVGVSLLAGILGLNRQTQLAAALIAATLPNAILQASGAKNDSLLAFFIIATLYLAAERQILWAALPLGLAIGTKGTAYLFLPPMLMAIWYLTRSCPVKWTRVATALTLALALNVPQYIRNLQLSGSPLGFDSAQADGVYRWRNDSIGVKPAVSNIFRNLSEQLGARSDQWNQRVYNTVIRAHQALGMNPEDPATTWRYAHFVAPKNTGHKADSNNRWHLLFLGLALLAMAAGIIPRRPLVYAAGLLAAFLFFCAYLKWQPYLARLELPLFLLAAPLIAALVVRPLVLQLALCLFLVSGTRLALIQNWTRPLRGPRSILHEPRDLQYFNDMAQFHNRENYLTAVDKFAQSGCSVIGIDINQNQLEYPFQALLLERNPQVRFVHVNVNNPSSRYARPGDSKPCAIYQVR